MRILYVLLTMSILINLTWFYKLKVRLWRERVKHWRLRRKDDWAMRVAHKIRLLDAVDVPVTGKQTVEAAGWKGAAYDQKHPNKMEGVVFASTAERLRSETAIKAGALSASELLNNQEQERLAN